ncbi:1-phosphatidylinositol 3-phosphate 5-kinase [Aplysia californica]|uniref:1-phosphatidylinositol-3-phosphate 5-kinase n=1 Tax=Aplysia californica TaxID=6500 RepID=A0ABM1VZC5_APLCA|nr:1-phosphatidylinositol 3-phosphate 5-kinase [Aplysia californica]
MAASANNNPSKRKIWDDSPVTFTEFGALSSDVKPSGGFFSRLWKKSKDGSPHASTSSLLTEDSGVAVSRDDVRAGSLPPDSASLSRQSSRSSTVTDADGTDQMDDTGENLGPGTRVPPHRTLTSVLSRLSSILDQRSSTPQTYKDSDFKQYWMPDSSCKECYDCGDKFTTFRRRHHCRICGQIFCSKCCNQELPGKIIGYKGGIRVCTYCCRVVQRYAQQSASTGDVRALEDLRAMSQIDHESGSFDFGNRSVSPRLVGGPEDLSPQYRGEQVPDLPGLKAPDLTTPFDLTPLSEFSSQESLLLESKVLIQDSVQLRELWRQICDTELGVETQTLRIRLRTHQNCIVGKELVDWLLKNDRAATRDQAMAIGQALIYAGYLESVGNQIPVFRDDFTLYRPGETSMTFEFLGDSEVAPMVKTDQETKEPKWFLEITKASEDDNDDSVTQLQRSVAAESETQQSNSSESESRTVFYLSETSRSGSFSEMPKTVTLMSRDMVEEPLPRQDSSVHGLGEDFLKGALFLGKPPMPSSDVITCPHGWRAVEQLREENGERLAYDRLKKAHKEHWQTLTRQLLGQYGLLLSWESVVSTSITQVSHFVRPDIRLEGDDMDIRHYVHIKKVPGGHKSDTSMFHGVIFTKNIAHKKMKTKIVNPLILLLRGTIEFQRVENKFSSLEPQILQEREFMKNCVMKMIAYRPNVVVVEKSVSRLAQEFLLEAGITLLYNVKLSVMERLARFTQAHIVPSIDGLVSKPNMGFCHDFRVHTYTMPNKETKTLAIFDGCATHLGCTIVLRGGTLNELRRVKHILKFMTYASYNSLLELCFCMDEFALPQPGADEIGQPFESLESSQEHSGDHFGDSIKSEEMAVVNPKDPDSHVEFHLEEDTECDIEIVDINNDVVNGSKDGGLNYTTKDKDVDSSSVDYSVLTDLSSDFAQLGEPKEEGDAEKSEKPGGGQWTGGSPDADVPTVTSDPVNQEEEIGEGEGQCREPEVHRQVHEGSKVTVVKDVACSVPGTEDSDTSPMTSKKSAQTDSEETLAGEKNEQSKARSSSSGSAQVASLAEMSAPQAMEYLTTAPLLSGQSVETKSRHNSGLSGCSSSHVCDSISGRSTPELALKTNTEDSIWNGSPKLIGNIVCIIPPSAIPFSAASTEKTAETSERKKHNSGSDILSQEDNKTKGSTDVFSSSFAKAVGKSDFSPSFRTKVLKSTDSVDKENMGSADQDSSQGSGKPAVTLSRPSTSKLTELTDFSDPLLGYQNTQDESIFSSTNTQKISLKEIKQTQYKRFRKALDGVHLSVSPYHKYTVPFIQTDKGARCAVRKFLPEEIFWSSLFDGEGGQRSGKVKLLDSDSSSKLSSKSNIQIMDSHAFITSNLTEPIWENSIQSILADFRARGGRINVLHDNNHRQQQAITEASGKKMDELFGPDNFSGGGPLWEKKLDCLDPMNHQRLMVLFSSFSFKSSNHPYPCVYPWVVTMEFYGRNDITLGGFLERFCFRPQYSCPSPTCDTPMTEHVRRFVHGSACINVLLKKLESDVPGGKENILMWSWCRKCKQVTPVVPISGDTWSLSFAKYLDLRFNSSSFLRRGSAEPCPHSLHHDHFQYFGHRNIVASFKFANISLKELALPATIVSLQPPTFDSVALTESVKNITYKAIDRYSLILESTMKLKQELTSESQTRTITEFLAEQQADKKNFRDAATNIQMKVKELIHSVNGLINSGQTDLDMTFHLYSIFDNIQLLKRHICEDVNKWNMRMQEFMAHQQKKSRTQTSNKKDKDSSAAVVTDELEKSWRAGSDKNSLKPLLHSSHSGGGNSLSHGSSAQGSPVPSHRNASPSGTTGSAQPASLTPASLVGSAGASLADGGASVQGVENSLKDWDTASASTTPNPTTKAEPSTGNDGMLSTAASSSSSGTSSPLPPSASSTPASELNVNIPPPLLTNVSTLSSASPFIVTPSAIEGLEDTPDGLFHDLKGFTRRFLWTSTFAPLAQPFDLNEHHTLPLCERVPIAVNDNEPSSIIAYALSSSDYLYRLREIQTLSRPGSADPSSAFSQSHKGGSKLGDSSVPLGANGDPSSETGKKSGGGVLSFLRGSSREVNPQQQFPGLSPTVEAVRYVPASERGEAVSASESVENMEIMDDSILYPDEKGKGTGSGNNGPSPHIELQFTDATAKFYCRVYFADQFRKLRKLIFPGSDNLFIRSLSRCKAWEAKGGKSGSSFSKTVDDRFILKQMSNMEVESFEKFGPQYFQYIKNCLADQQPTALAKILGVFRIGFRNSQTNHALRQDVLVMENLFYSRKITQKFDLKGSMRNRLVNTASKRAEEELVLLDENLLKSSVESPLYLRPHSKSVLKSAITSDSSFLSSNLVMDYSLLVGIDDDTHELVVGIIDYIRTFTWDKKLEMVVKSTGILGGQGKMPTVVSPQLYKGRFLEAMDRYFLQVPDRWMGLGRESTTRAHKVETTEGKESARR